MIATWALVLVVFSAIGNEKMTLSMPEIPTENHCIAGAKEWMPTWFDFLREGDRIEIRCFPVTGDPIVDGVNRAVIEGRPPIVSYGPKGE